MRNFSISEGDAWALKMGCEGEYDSDDPLWEAAYSLLHLLDVLKVTID